tara:strand:+ start:139 stop:579 length:441 start_codon:yes stop_codon:yes gene_type:complete
MSTNHDNLTSRITQLADLLHTHQLTELEIQYNTEQRIRLVKSHEPQTTIATPPLQATNTKRKEGHTITAPMVGTIYLAPNPEAAPYKHIGDVVNKGDTLCLIEAMKMFSQLKADCSGILREVNIKNGQLVEYGQELFIIERHSNNT